MDRDRLNDGLGPKASGWRRRKLATGACTICEKEEEGFSRPASWWCPCGFRICRECMDENSWGLTCNGITWECPDCGRFRSF